MWLFDAILEPAMGLVLIVGPAILGAGAAYVVFDQAARANWSALESIVAMTVVLSLAFALMVWLTPECVC